MEHLPLLAVESLQAVVHLFIVSTTTHNWCWFETFLEGRLRNFSRFVHAIDATTPGRLDCFSKCVRIVYDYRAEDGVTVSNALAQLFKFGGIYLFLPEIGAISS